VITRSKGSRFTLVMVPIQSHCFTLDIQHSMNEQVHTLVQVVSSCFLQLQCWHIHVWG